MPTFKNPLTIFCNKSKPEETVTVPLDMTNGDQKILPPEGKTLSEVIIEKQPEFIGENIAEDVILGGVEGKMPRRKTEEAKIVELNLTSGNQIILPTNSNEVLSSVEIIKDPDLSALNLRKNKIVGGYVGELEPAKPEESKTMEPNFSAGNQTITPTDPNAVLSRVELIKPSNLTSPNVRENENICGIVGSMKPAKPEESVTVALDMVNGNQVLLPTSDKVLTKVEILKDPDHKAENILKGKVIGKVEGVAESGGGGGDRPEGTYLVRYRDFDGTILTTRFVKEGEFIEDIQDTDLPELRDLIEKRREYNIEDMTPQMIWAGWTGMNIPVYCDTDVATVWTGDGMNTYFFRGDFHINIECSTDPAEYGRFGYFRTSRGDEIEITSEMFEKTGGEEGEEGEEMEEARWFFGYEIIASQEPNKVGWVTLAGIEQDAIHWCEGSGGRMEVNIGNIVAKYISELNAFEYYNSNNDLEKVCYFVSGGQEREGVVGAYKLKFIALPTTIASGTLWSCRALEDVVLERYVGLSPEAFLECNKLTKITMYDSNMSGSGLAAILRSAPSLTEVTYISEVASVTASSPESVFNAVPTLRKYNVIKATV